MKCKWYRERSHILAHFLCEDSSSFAEKSSYRLIAKGCTLRNGKLPLHGLSGNSVVRITDRPETTSAVYRRHKAKLK